MEKTLVSYEQINLLVNLLSLRVNRECDYIIGIGRGGLIPATMLAYKLNKKVLQFGISTYNNENKISTCEIYQDLNINLDSNKKYIVIDDICDSGNTFKIFKERYSSTNEFQFVSLFAKEDTKHTVDFYGTVVSDDIWIDFPWE